MADNRTLQLDELRAFARVAELASFSRAAEQLGLARGQVSAAVQRLEARLGARLLQRTTRSVRLSADGEQFLPRCQDLLADAEQLQGMFQPVASGLRGRVRLDLPQALARDLVIPHLPDLLQRHPQLEVGISTSDRRVDVVREGFDIVLRVGRLADVDLAVRPLGEMTMCNVASPAYLRAHGVPRSLDDLAAHRLVHYAPGLGTQGAAWEHVDAAGVVRERPMRCSLVVNGTDACTAACLAGLGLIQVPHRGARRLIEAGLLQEVLPAHRAAPMPVSLLYPHRRQLAPRVRAMLDWIAGIVGPDLAALPAG